MAEILALDWIREVGDWKGIDCVVVNNLTAKCVGLETCCLNVSYICLLTLTYPKIELAELID